MNWLIPKNWKQLILDKQSRSFHFPLKFTKLLMRVSNSNFYKKDEDRAKAEALVPYMICGVVSSQFNINEGSSVAGTSSAYE